MLQGLIFILCEYPAAWEHCMTMIHVSLYISYYFHYILHTYF